MANTSAPASTLSSLPLSSAQKPKIDDDKAPVSRKEFQQLLEQVSMLSTHLLQKDVKSQPQPKTDTATAFSSFDKLFQAGLAKEAANTSQAKATHPQPTGYLAALQAATSNVPANTATSNVSANTATTSTVPATSFFDVPAPIVSSVKPNDDTSVEDHIMRVISLYGSLQQFVKQKEWNQPRNYHECMALAKIGDLMLKDGISPQAPAFDVLARRLAGVTNADKSGDWDVCSQLTGLAFADSLLPQAEMKRAMESAVLFKKLVAKPREYVKLNSKYNSNNENRYYNSNKHGYNSKQPTPYGTSGPAGKAGAAKK